MKKRMLATLLALCMVLSLGAGALATEEELNDYQLTGPEMAALSEALGGSDRMDVDNAFFHIILTYEQASKSQAFTYADAIADVLAADGDNSPADQLASMFGIGYEEELEAVTAISDWLNEQQMDEDRTAAFFQSLSDGMNWPTDAYEAFAEELFSGREAAPAEDAAIEDGGSVSAYHLTVEDVQAFADTLGSFDREDIFHAFDLIRLTVELYPSTYTDALADILDGGDGDAEQVAANFSIGSEAQVEVVAAVSDWIEQQQIEQDRVEGFFSSLFIVDDISETFDALDKLLTGELLPAEDAAAVPAEPIEFDVDHLNTDETGAVLGTVTVPADGCYLFTVSLSPMDEDADVTFTSDLPIQTDLAAVPVDELAQGLQYIYAVVELTAGDYTVAVGNAYYSAYLIPVQMVDSLEGRFAPDSVYVCQLAEPVTVTYTADSMLYSRFYGGAEGGFLQDLAPDSETSDVVTVEFPAGLAVIDASDGIFTITGTVN